MPGAFDPLNIALATLHLDPLTVQVTKKNAVADHTIDRVILNDGGVYDNMADQWEYGYPNRADEWSGPNGLASIQQHRASYLIVVNGSQGWNTPRPIGKGGFTQEKEGLMRAQGVQYDVSTSHRRQALYTLFRAAEARPTGAVDGIFAQINDSPYRIPINFGSIALAKARAENKPGLWDDDMAARADEAVAFLDTQPDYQPEFWSALAAANASTKTTLAKLGPARAATLLEHGYVLTMVLMYVLDNRGTLRPIDRTRFQRLCS